MSTPLDMFALPGHKVKLLDTLAHREYPGDQDRNWKRYLTAGRIYTVKQTRVFQSNSWVELEEVPGVKFTWFDFESVTEQTLQETQTHPDYIRYFGHRLPK